MLRLDHFLAAWRGGPGLRRPAWRRWLAFPGRSVEQSPWRRLVQAAAFAVFLLLALWTAWPYGAQPAAGQAGWPTTQADHLAARQFLPVDAFLAIDPLVPIATAIAARSWVWSLAATGVILAVCLLVPRGFCGYLCPLGTLIDLFDWAIGRRITRFRAARIGWWGHLRHLLLAASLLAAVAGVMLAGTLAAIPLLTRGLAAAIDPLRCGLALGWTAVPPPDWGHALSLALLAGVLGLGLLRPRFWCRHVCPSGAVFSLASRLRAVERRVGAACTGCGSCIQACPFDAINPDWSTRTDACTLCQTCGGACPARAIAFVPRGAAIAAAPLRPEAAQPAVTRRALLGAGLGGALGAVGVRLGSAPTGDEAAVPLLRPPGAVPEDRFLAQCIRCDNCLRVCPNHVLQPLGFERGIDGLWTPVVRPDWAGCESSCNACGQACPTGAIRDLPLEEKRHARIGLAIVDEGACLPWAGQEPCQLCVDACRLAGYEAIEFRKAHVEVDADGQPVAGSGFDAPWVDAARCVGCGQCQSRCAAINVRERGFLPRAAIAVAAGPGRSDRLAAGSYRALREAEAAERARSRPAEDGRLDGIFR